MRWGTLRVLKIGNSQIKPLHIINWTEFNSSYTFFPNNTATQGKGIMLPWKEKLRLSLNAWVQTEILGTLKKTNIRNWWKIWNSQTNKIKRKETKQISAGSQDLLFFPREWPRDCCSSIHKHCQAVVNTIL